MGPENDPNRYGVYITCEFERQTAGMVLKFESWKQIYKFGIYETPQFAEGTRAMAKLLAALKQGI